MTKNNPQASQAVSVIGFLVMGEAFIYKRQVGILKPSLFTAFQSNVAFTKIKGIFFKTSINS